MRAVSIAIPVIVLIMAVMVIKIYNNLVTLRNRFRNAFAQIDVQLKRRYDLIPNLVETVKGYLKHERETLESVIKARNQAASAEKTAAAHPEDPGAMKELLKKETQLGGAMGRLLVTVERYPNLKADRSISQLMEELTSTENKISFARQAYNDMVMRYNTSREVFPNVLLSGPMGFKEAILFEVESEEEKKAPSVSF